MICIAKNPIYAMWHAGFLAMLPRIQQSARFAFRHLRPEARQEAVQEVLANAWRAYARLAELDKVNLAYPTVLARYAITQVNEGRQVGNRRNIAEVLSPRAQRRRGFAVQRLTRFGAEEGGWKELIVEDRHATPADVVRVRIDFAAWLKTLSRRMRRIAELLAEGHRAVDVARRFQVSRARISQVQRELKYSWQAFIGEQATMT